MEVLRKAFVQPLAPAVSEFVGCIDDDRHIVDADIQGSLAHATMLGQTGLLTQEQAANLVQGLHQLQASYRDKSIELKPEWEDVHMNVEKQLGCLIGADSLRLHTARSRNDQVALDMRLYIAQQIEEILALLKEVGNAFLDLAEGNAQLVMPGYTHLQRAQPVLFAHALLAFVEMLQRDAARFSDALKRVTVSPLGAGALSGTSLPIDPQLTADCLGFAGVFANSIDAVSDRDFLVEFVSACSICSVHLSQVAETFILWASSEFGFVSFGDAVTTASSLMPNKKNPDPLEIMRAKCGGISGDLVNLLMTLKGLPLGYNRDLQETKPPVIHSAQTLKACLVVLKHVVAATAVNCDAMEAAAADPMLFATDIVEYLIRAGMPMRQAHDVVSEVVAICRETHRTFAQIPLTELRKFSPLFGMDVYDLLNPVVSAGLKSSPGGTSPARVQAAIIQLRRALA
jgi:argininosuccinate lyase